MNFNQLWTLMQESITLEAPIQVEFKTITPNQFYEGKWIIGDINYRAFATHTEKNLPHNYQKMTAFEIFFQSSKTQKSFSMDITGTAKSKAISVYNGLLIFIKKLIEKQEQLNKPVEAIVFLGSEEKMDILYDKFFKMFLGDKFKRLDAETIISNTAIEKIHQEKPEYQIHKRLQDAEEQHQKLLDYYRQNARNQRKKQNTTNFFNQPRNPQ